MNDFIKAIFGKPSARCIIIAEFTDGTTAEYTENIINLLLTDTAVNNIADAETGEILYFRDEHKQLIKA